MAESSTTGNPPIHSDDRNAISAVEGLFNTHEARVLGAIGLFTGYICVFFTKIMSFTQMYVGVLAVTGLTFLLLVLNREFDFKSRDWWIRSAAVIVLSLLLTSPQLYFAWTVSVTEAQLAAQATQNRALLEAAQFVQ
jgi:hypothetical protein